MISINKLSVSFTGKTLFDDVSFIIKDKDRIGLRTRTGSASPARTAPENPPC